MIYEASLEKRRGPWGLIRRQQPMGQVKEGKSYSSDRIGVVAYVDGVDSLIIATQGNSLTVEFAAELQRFRPKIGSLLDEDQPEIRTTRRQVVVYSKNNPNERLILRAPAFEPLRITVNTPNAAASIALKR